MDIKVVIAIISIVMTRRLIKASYNKFEHQREMKNFNFRDN
jgi:hypothetical protein